MSRHHDVSMEARQLDVVIGVITMIFFIIFLFILQGSKETPSGYGYLIALILFIVILSVAGYFINEKIT